MLVHYPFADVLGFVIILLTLLSSHVQSHELRNVTHAGPGDGDNDLNYICLSGGTPCLVA